MVRLGDSGLGLVHAPTGEKTGVIPGIALSSAIQTDEPVTSLAFGKNGIYSTRGRVLPQTYPIGYEGQRAAKGMFYLKGGLVILQNGEIGGVVNYPLYNKVAERVSGARISVQAHVNYSEPTGVILDVVSTPIAKVTESNLHRFVK